MERRVFYGEAAGDDERQLGAYLQSDGKLGECPDWYLAIRSARYLNVPPWDLAGVPDTAGHECWQAWGLWAQNAEVKATNAARKQAKGRR